MQDKNQQSRLHLRNDILVIVVLLVLSALGAIYLFCLRTPGTMVQVTVDGKRMGEYALSEDRVQEIPGYMSGMRNRLIIRDGKAYVQEASCPDGICVDHAPIFREGESIICLPNRVVVTVVGSDEDAPDLVA